MTFWKERALICQREEKMSKKYFFIDESGDPNFFDRKWNLIVGNLWCSEYLRIWFFTTEDPSAIRKEIIKIKNEVLADELYIWVPSVEKRRSKFFFHASEDIPCIMEKFIRMIKTLPIKAHIYIVKKQEYIFKTHYNSNPNLFYDGAVKGLFNNQLDNMNENHLYFEKRQKKLREANIKNALYDGNNTIQKENIKVFIQTSTDEPCLQIIDYILWAVQRKIVKGEDRFFDYLNDKIILKII